MSDKELLATLQLIFVRTAGSWTMVVYCNRCSVLFLGSPTPPQEHATGYRDKRPETSVQESIDMAEKAIENLSDLENHGR